MTSNSENGVCVSQLVWVQIRLFPLTHHCEFSFLYSQIIFMASISLRQIALLYIKRTSTEILSDT